MLSELDRILDETRKDKGIDREVLVNALETALVKAALNKYGHSLDIEAHYNPELGEIELFQYKTVAETWWISPGKFRFRKPVLFCRMPKSAKRSE